MFEACPTHCCPVHGCKYGLDDCPVSGGAVAPTYPANNGCEQCEADLAARRRWPMLTERFPRSGGYSLHREPINVAPQVRERLHNLLAGPAFAGTGVGYSAFIDRACEIAEQEIAMTKGMRS